MTRKVIDFLKSRTGQLLGFFFDTSLLAYVDRGPLRFENDLQSPLQIFHAADHGDFSDIAIHIDRCVCQILLGCQRLQ